MVMKSRVIFSLLCLFSLIASALPLASAAQPMEPDIQSKVVRLEPGNGWAEASLGDQGSTAEYVQFLGGVPQYDGISQLAIDAMSTYGLQDAISAYSAFLPETPRENDSTTQTLTRVYRFNDEAGAKAYLDSYWNYQQLTIAEGTTPDTGLALMDLVPTYEHPLIGWTSFQARNSHTTGAYVGNINAARYSTQISNFVISVEVAGPFADYNFDAAFWMMDAGVACIESQSPCPYWYMPMGDGDYSWAADSLISSDGNIVPWIFPIDEVQRAPVHSAVVSDTAPAAHLVTGSNAVAATQNQSEAAPATESTTTTTATVIATSANIRAMPSASAAVVAAATNGQVLTVTGESVSADGYEWIPVKTADGVEGWIASQLITGD